MCLCLSACGGVDGIETTRDVTPTARTQPVSTPTPTPVVTPTEYLGDENEVATFDVQVEPTTAPSTGESATHDTQTTAGSTIKPTDGQQTLSPTSEQVKTPGGESTAPGTDASTPTPTQSSTPTQETQSPVSTPTSTPAQTPSKKTPIRLPIIWFD